ncbi:MAG: acetyl-CoA carboxylase biotin carboxyl carrier protein subunit, partial [Bacteroidetes bacterium]|nr:acetyl-CoA carboxylase biotin carboxyl carrier protein subunit [Bacteroidota bacterium]
ETYREFRVRAPMPGLVLKVWAKTGMHVSKDDPLLVLEAMKMENEIRSPGAGIVSIVHVKSGEVVLKGSLLVELDCLAETE